MQYLRENEKVYVHLSSNGSLDFYPNNTLTRFTNILGKEIRSPPNARLYVRIKSIALSQKRLINQRDLLSIDKYVFISLGNLETQNVNSSQLPILASYRLKDNYDKRSLYQFHFFKNSPILSLRNSPTLSHLRIELTNGKLEPLNLANGPPTFVCLEIGCNMSNQDEFTITCYSHGEGSKRFPDNTPCDFQCALNEELNLANYEVALLNLHMPHPFPGGRRAMITVTKSVQDGEEDDDLDANNSTYYFFTRARPNSSASSLTKKLNDKMLESTGFAKNIKLIVEQQEHPNHLCLSLENKNTFSVIINLNYFLYSLFGARAYHQREYVVKPNYTKPLYYLGYGFKPERTKPPQLSMLYSSIIEENFVNHMNVPLMEIIPMNNDGSLGSDKSNYYEPNHLTFNKLKSAPFNVIHFSLKMGDGSNYPFEEVDEEFNKRDYDFGGTIATLLFRKIKR